MILMNNKKLVHRTISVYEDDWEELQKIMGTKMNVQDVRLVCGIDDKIFDDNIQDNMEWDFSKWVRKKVMEEKNHPDWAFDKLDSLYCESKERVNGRFKFMIIELILVLEGCIREMDKLGELPAPGMAQRMTERRKTLAWELDRLRELVKTDVI